MHQFTRSIPSSQCMNCHMHQGNLFVNPYLGYTWWDQETDGEVMYPKEQRNPTDDELVIETQSNPEAAAAKGLWGDREFLDKVSELNPKLKHTQFADYHGHGWVFRAIFKHDRKGNLLDLHDNKILDSDPQKFAKAVHLKDVHLAHGMQCADCHFEKDVHGNGMLYGEPRNATTINCIDCHGTVDQRPSLVTTGNAGAVNLGETSNTPWGPRFVWEGTKLYQQSVMSPDARWEIPQTIDTVDPLSSHYNPKSAYAKTLQRDGRTWGGIVPADPAERHARYAHDNSAMDCQICHTSWATSCFGCHLPKNNDTNAGMTQLLGFGTGTVNFFGRYAYVGEGREGFHAVIWTEPDEPQAAIGSHLHKIAYPDNYRKHLEAGSILKEAHEHSGHDIEDIVLRGEYLYTANGPGGFEVFDVANIDQKGFSERIVSAPVSPLGQRTRVNTKYATSVAIPSTLALDPARVRIPENEEQPIDLFYAFVYVSDREEGLVGSNVATLVDGNPDNNFLKRDVTYNPDGALTGATFVTAAGHRLYMTTPRGLFVIDCTDPMHPRLAGQYTGNFLRNPHCVAIQFRYAFVTDDDGLKILDITDPTRPVPVRGAVVPLHYAYRLIVAG